MMNKKTIFWFLGITFAFSWSMFLIPLAFKANSVAYQQTAALFWAIGMWGPGLAALFVTIFIAKEPFSSLRLNRLGKFRYYLAAWFLPPLLTTLTIIASILIGTAQYDPEFTTMQAIAKQSSQAGVNISVTTLILIQLTQGLILGPIINVFVTMGEELGWRGFLLPKLLPMGEWRALIWGGVIWGVWHAPVILQGHNYPDHPFLGVILMIIFCIFLSVIIGWMYLRTRSPWSAAIAHGSVNAWGGLAIVFLIPGFDTAFGGTLPSITGIALLALLVGLLIITKGLPVGEEEPV
jgi:membrane protease YdiL (CAAX protease family)